MLSSRFALVMGLLLSPVLLSACVINITRYTDGPVTEYLQQPLPELDEPIARTLSVEQVSYNTASSQKGTMIGDLVAREIFILPASVGNEVGALLEMDKEFSKAATRAALNRIAEGRSEARQAGTSNKLGKPLTGNTSGRTQTYIQQHEERAREAYAQGDYLTGDINSSAASNAMRIDQAFSGAQATSDVMFSTLGAVSAAGQGMIKSEFNTLRNWIEKSSGAIGASAPEGTHLSVFLLSYFDAKSFQLDSRMRAAVYLVLTDKNGNTSVLEGSDILNCEGECNLFQPKPTAKVFDQLAPSNEVQRLLSTPDGLRSLEARGFEGPVGPYQFVLLKHGLAKLATLRQ